MTSQPSSFLAGWLYVFVAPGAAPRPPGPRRLAAPALAAARPLAARPGWVPSRCPSWRWHTRATVDIDFGAPQAQRRFTAHRHQMLPLATVQAAVFEVPYLFWVATRQHLGHQVIVVGRLVAWMGMLKCVPMIGKNLLEDAPVPSGFGHHRVTPSWGVGKVAVQRLYHSLPASSTPYRPVSGPPHPPRSSLMNGSFQDQENAFSYTI